MNLKEIAKQSKCRAGFMRFGGAGALQGNTELFLEGGELEREREEARYGSKSK